MAFGSHVERGAGPLDRYFYPLPGDTNIVASHPKRRISSAGTRAAGGGMTGLSSSNQRRNSKNEICTTSTSSGGEEYIYTPTQQRISSSSRASVSTGGKTKKRYFKPAKKKSFHQTEREYYANALRERRESLSKIDTRRRSRASGSSMDSWGLPDNMVVGAGWNGDSTEDDEPPLHLFPPTTAPMSAAERAAGQLGTAAGFDDDFRNSLNDYESTSGGPGGPSMHDSVVDALGLGDFFAGGTKADRTSAMGRRTFPNSAAFDIVDINRNTIMAGVELGANKGRQGASPAPGVSRRLSFDAGDEEGARFLTAVQDQELDAVGGEDPPRFQTVISEPKDADDEADYDVDARLRETTGTASLMDYLPLQCARRKPPGGAVVRRRGRDGRMKAGYERYSAAPEAATDYDGDRNTVQQKYVEENVAATTAKQNPGVKKSARFDQILVSPPRRGTKRSPHVPKRGSNVVSRMKSSTTGEDASGTSPKGIGSQSSQASKRDNMLKAVLGAAAASSPGGKNKKEKRKRSGSKKSGSPRGSTRPGHKSPVPLSGEDTPKKNKKAAAKKKNGTRKAGGTTAEEAAGVVPHTRQNTSTAAVDAVLDAMGDFTHFYAALSPDEESNEFERHKMQQRPLKRTMSTRTYETNELWRQFEASHRPQGDQLDSQLERLADEYIQGERERMTRGPSGVDFAKVSQAFRADKRVTECFAYVGSEAKDEQGKAEHTSELQHEKSPALGLGVEQHDTGGASSSQQHDPEQERAAASNAPEDEGPVSTGVLEDPDAGLAPAFGRNMNPLSAEGFLLGTLCSKNTLSRLLNLISLGACVTVLVSSYPDFLGTGPRRYTDSEVNKVLGHFGITQQEAAAAGMKKWRVATQQQHQSEAGAASAAASWTSPLAGAIVSWAQSKIAEARAITGSSLIAGRSHFFESVETIKERYEGSGGVSGAGAFFEVAGDEGSHVHAKNRKGAAADDPILHEDERPGSGTTQVPAHFDKDFLLHDDIANAHRASSGAPPRPAQPRRAHQRDDASADSKGSSFDVGGFLSDMFFGTVSRIANNDMIRHKNNNSHLATSKRGPGAATVTFADLQQQQLDPRDIDIGEPEKVEDDNTSGGAGADMIRATSRSTEPFQDIDMETNATELKTMNSSRRREQAARPYAYSPDGGSQSASVDADALDLEPDTDSDEDLDEGMIPPVNDMRISAAMGAAELGSGAERFSSGGASMMSGVVILEDETSILTAENRASRGGFFCCS
eukprot:g8904.t1